MSKGDAAAPVIPAFDADLFGRVLDRLAATAHSEHNQRWLILEAAHVLGQTRFAPHLRVHVLMLREARLQRDWSEAMGQVLRLGLVPLGHLSGRLPIGNPGRANVSAFQPMPLREDIAAVLRDAVRV